MGEETTLDSDILMAEVENEAPQKEKKRSKVSEPYCTGFIYDNASDGCIQHSETVEDDEEDQDYTEKQQADADSDCISLSCVLCALCRVCLCVCLCVVLSCPVLHESDLTQ